MNDPIFSQMKEQLIPSPAARAALEEGLSRPVRRLIGRNHIFAAPFTGAGTGCWPPASFWRPPCRWDTPSSLRPSTAM